MFAEVVRDISPGKWMPLPTASPVFGADGHCALLRKSTHQKYRIDLQHSGNSKHDRLLGMVFAKTITVLVVKV